MKDQRYLVVDGSQSAHCCFSFTVVDTTKPVMIGGAHYEGRFDPLCECWERAEADRIVDALNSLEVASANQLVDIQTGK